MSRLRPFCVPRDLRRVLALGAAWLLVAAAGGCLNPKPDDFPSVEGAPSDSSADLDPAVNSGNDTPVLNEDRGAGSAQDDLDGAPSDENAPPAESEPDAGAGDAGACDAGAEPPPEANQP